MIIEKVRLLNYKCYYGEKEFSFTNGLNFILGKNGEGKTKFFESLEWLFDVKKEAKNSDFEIISAKRLSEMQSDASSKVEVEITLKSQLGEKTLLGKRLEFSKIQDRAVKPLTSYYAKFYDNKIDIWKNIEIDSRQEFSRIRDRVMPSKIISSIFFKGEESLNRNQAKSALEVLVTDHTDSKVFSELAGEMNFFSKKANDASVRNTKTNSKKSKEIEGVNVEIKHLSRKKFNLERSIEFEKETENTHKIQIKKLDDIIESSEALGELKQDIDTYSEKIRKVQGIISNNERYNEELFDSNWVLLHFKQTLSEFTSKVETWHKERREKERDFDKKLAKEETIKELLELPIGTPSRKHMVEMIDAKHCKVCNRPALDESEPLKYMIKRLEEYDDYIKNKAKSKKSEKKCFSNNYIKGINKFWDRIEESSSILVNSLNGDIIDRFEFLNDRRIELSNLRERQNELENQASNILGSNFLTYESATATMQKYRNHSEALLQVKDKLNVKRNELQIIDEEIKELNKKLEDLKLSILSPKGVLFDKKSKLYEDFSNIFYDLERKDLEYLNKQIVEKTNEYYSKVNTGYKGKIKWEFDEKSNKLVDFYMEGDPSQSQQTRLVLSLLVAIQDKWNSSYEINDFEKYPMVMDAPISNFDSDHSNAFLTTVSELTDQSIILLKDYFDENGEVDIDYLEKINSKSIHVLSLNDSLEDGKIDTIDTNIKKIL